MKKLLFVLAIYVVCFSTPAPAAADSFQQVVNFLASGDPFNDVAVIHDRKNCITGTNKGREEKIYWNNIDTNSIIVEYARSQTVLTFSGPEIVYEAFGMTTKSMSLILGPKGRFNIQRVIKSIEILFSRHCTGSKRRSAF